MKDLRLFTRFVLKNRNKSERSEQLYLHINLLLSNSFPARHLWRTTLWRHIRILGVWRNRTSQLTLSWLKLLSSNELDQNWWRFRIHDSKMMLIWVKLQIPLKFLVLLLSKPFPTVYAKALDRKQRLIEWKKKLFTVSSYEKQKVVMMEIDGNGWNEGNSSVKKIVFCVQPAQEQALWVNAVKYSINKTRDTPLCNGKTERITHILRACSIVALENNKSI